MGNPYIFKQYRYKSPIFHYKPASLGSPIYGNLQKKNMPGMPSDTPLWEAPASWAV